MGNCRFFFLPKAENVSRKSFSYRSLIPTCYRYVDAMKNTGLAVPFRHLKYNSVTKTIIVAVEKKTQQKQTKWISELSAATVAWQRSRVSGKVTLMLSHADIPSLPAQEQRILAIAPFPIEAEEMVKKTKKLEFDLEFSTPDFPHHMEQSRGVKQSLDPPLIFIRKSSPRCKIQSQKVLPLREDETS